VLDRGTGEFVGYERTAGGATVAEEQRLGPDAAGAELGADWTRAVEESELLSASGDDLDDAAFNDATATPVLFGSAVRNFGVGHLLQQLVARAPHPEPRPDAQGRPRELDAPFSAFVFKVQTGMDPAHRDRVAFARVCSGTFERGVVATHAHTGKPFATKYAQQVFGQQRDTVEQAYPGDVVGLVNAAALRVGDTLYTGKPPVEFPGIPSFAPEHFAIVRANDPSRSKQFRRGIEQLAQEGVVQVLKSDKRGDSAPVLAAVGPMQFDVATQRMESEFRAPVKLEHLPYHVVRILDDQNQRALAETGTSEVLDREDGTPLALFTDDIAMRSLLRIRPQLKLSPVIGDSP
jgi:peptide chain release factor 3